MKFRELYLDTTYVMPFFYLDIDVKGFSRTVYKEVIKSVERIHVCEISIDVGVKAINWDTLLREMRIGDN